MSVTTYTTVNGQILCQAKDGVVHHFVSDPLGSVVMVRDNSGNTVYEAEYDPYGNVQSETGTNPSEFGYVGTLGYVKDSAFSLYVRARYLLTNLGRWLTKDPLWPSELGFVYAGAKPVAWVDPTGLWPQTDAPCPKHGWGGEYCTYVGPPYRGHDADPSYWRCGDDFYSKKRCYDCLMDIYKRTGKAYKGLVGFPNAMRHCVGTCLAEQECRATCAALVNLHELQSWFTADSERDRHNNSIGAGFGKQRPRVNCHNKCGEAYKDGRLR